MLPLFPSELENVLGKRGESLAWLRVRHPLLYGQLDYAGTAQDY